MLSAVAGAILVAVLLLLLFMAAEFVGCLLFCWCVGRARIIFEREMDEGNRADEA
jgi:hypothetical protein